MDFLDVIDELLGEGVVRGLADGVRGTCLL
jgi:hypothetical protein